MGSNNLRRALETIERVYSNTKYFYFTIISSIIFFLIFYKLTLVNVANSDLKIFIMMQGANYSFFTFLSFWIIAILFSVYISIAIYRFNLIKSSGKKKGFLANFFGFTGFSAGVFGAGCPTCGSIVFALFGAPLALMYFPFGGAELRVLSMIILLISIYILSRSSIKCDVKRDEIHK